MRNAFIEFFVDYGTAIQTLTSVTLLIVTAIYVVATFKMIHATQKTFLRPVNIEYGEEKSKIIIKNYGLGTAINVKVFVEYKDSNKKIQISDDVIDYMFKILKENYLMTNTEGFEIEPNQSSDFFLEENVGNINKMVVYWESISGEKTILKFFVATPSMGNIKILKYRRIKVKSMRNIILNPIQFLTKQMVSGSFFPTYIEYVEIEKKKKEKKDKKWLL